MLNFKYWSLLNEVLTSVIPASANPLNNPARLWLVPLVNRVPIVPVLTTLLNLFSVDSCVSEEPLLSLAFRSFYALWPYASPKITLDSLLDCSGALFGYLSASSCKVLEPTDLESDLAKLASTVYTSYRESLGNAAHKKKVGKFSSFQMYPTVSDGTADLRDVYSTSPSSLAYLCVLEKRYTRKR